MPAGHFFFRLEERRSQQRNDLDGPFSEVASFKDVFPRLVFSRREYAFSRTIPCCPSDAAHPTTFTREQWRRFAPVIVVHVTRALEQATSATCNRKLSSLVARLGPRPCQIRNCHRRLGASATQSAFHSEFKVIFSLDIKAARRVGCFPIKGRFLSSHSSLLVSPRHVNIKLTRRPSLSQGQDH